MGFFVCGIMGRFGLNMKKSYLLLIFFTGILQAQLDSLWTKSYGDTLSDGGYFIQQTNDSDEEEVTVQLYGTAVMLAVDEIIIPKKFAVHQNHPNPFNPVTTLRYDLPDDALVKITIYDLMGKIVNNLVSSQNTAGYKSIIWNATNNEGQPVSAGLYLYTIQVGKFRQTEKMVLLK